MAASGSAVSGPPTMGRPIMAPLPEGAPDLQPLVELVLDLSAEREVFVAHGERTVVAGADRLGRDVVVKIDRDPARPERETNVLRALSAAGVPVPEVLAAERHVQPVDAHVLVLERVAGRPLTAADPEDTWRVVGSVLRALHDALPPGQCGPFVGHGDASFADHLAGWIASLRHEGETDGWMSRAQGRRFEELARSALTRPGPVRLLHGDCSPQHWLLSPGERPRPVDLGDAGAGDPAWDLTVLTIDTPDRRAALLDGYRADPARRGHVASAMPGLVVLRLAGSVSWLVEHGFDPTPEMGRLHRALG